MADNAVPEIPARMLPTLSEVNRTFWTGGADGRLHIAWCARCDRFIQPPASDCPDCAGELEFRAVSGRGTVFTYTVNYQPYMPNVPVPYVIAIVELAEQADLRIATNIVDCDVDSVHVGLPVEVRFERHEVEGDTVFYPVFAPRR